MNDQTVMQQLAQQSEQWAQAVLRQDLAAVEQFYGPQLRAFDAVKQLEFTRAAYFTHWQQCMEFCTGHSAFELKDRQLSGGPELALLTCLLYCGGTNEQGEPQGCWMRLTQGWQLQQGQWRIIHDHFSVPFDMVSGSALFNLQPEAA